jgi:tetratricopeptide (TPR) repeat protein
MSAQRSLAAQRSLVEPPGRPPSIDLLVGGVECHKRGDFARAESLYRQCLDCDPREAHAWHLLGLLMTQTGRVESGIETIDRALALDPDYLDALNSRGNACQALERFEDALQSYDRALAVKPDFVDALINRGNTLVALKRYAAALDSFDRALEKRSDHAEAWNNRGVALRELKRIDEALVCYDRALALKPNYGDALVNRGNALNRLKRFEESLACYDGAMALAPDNVDLHIGRGEALTKLKRWDDALASFDRSLAIVPNYVEVYSNRAVTYMDMRRFDEALASLDRALEVDPDYAGAWNNRGEALRKMKRFEEAFACFDKALALQPDFGDAALNRALAKLLTGDFVAGWPAYEARWRSTDPLYRAFRSPLPEWRGQEIAGRRIVVFEEQGNGDTLQFCRYLTLLEARGADVVFLCRPSLVALMRTRKGSARPMSAFPAEPFDYQCPLLSLPLAFGTTLETIPSGAPYLGADPARVAKWRARLGEGGFKIGVAWEGSAFGTRLGKSFPLARLEGLSRLPGVRLVSLQKNQGAEQLAALPQGMTVETLGEDFDAGPDAFLDTAAVMQSLDLIVSTDTSVPHLAAALGRPTWVALPYDADWRWLVDRPDTPWYPTMRLFRQSAWDQWDHVFQDMERALRQRLGEP